MKGYWQILLTIEKLIYGGFGLGRADGKAVFVPYSAPGDILEVEIVAKFKSYDEAAIKEIITPSADRVQPKCRYYGVCGGCHLQHIKYETQLYWKRLILEEQLIRLGGIKEPEVLSVIQSPDEWGYRSRIQVHSDGNKIGFHEARTNRVVDVDFCPIAAKEINEKLEEERRHWPKGVTRLEISADPTGVFRQVNLLANEKLKQLVGEWAAESEDVLELYAGSGNLTFEIAKIAKSVTAVELDKTAVASGIQSAKESGIANVRFVADRVENIFISPPLLALSKVEGTGGGRPARLACVPQARVAGGEEGGHDLILADPPREGLGEKIVNGIASLNPKNIIYVSCDPSTLARDIKQFQTLGYKLQKTHPIDMFPQTYHIESVNLLAFV